METAKIFDFNNGEELNIKVLEGGKKVKLTKEGKIKQTPNNNKADRLVMPIKKVEDPLHMTSYISLERFLFYSSRILYTVLYLLYFLLA